MTQDMGAAQVQVQVQDTPSPSPALLALLEAHLPHSFPVLRRLQFRRPVGPGGIGRTPHTHVLHARHHQQEEEEGGDGLPGKGGAGSGGHFAVACVDLSRGLETQAWVYSSLEDGENHYHHHHQGEVDNPMEVGGGGGGGGGAGPGPYRSWEGRTAQEEEGLDLVLALLRRIRAITIAYSSSSSSSGGNGEGGEVLIGSLHESIRQGLLARGVRMHKSANIPPEVDWEFCGKWLFRVEDLPLAGALPEGLRWDRVIAEDVAVVLERTSIKRRPETLLTLPSMAIRLEDGTPIAWAFMGFDGTIITLHVEEPYRQRGLAKTLACKLMRERIPEYGDDGWGAADVFVGNHKSQALCRSLGGKNSWVLSWAVVDLSSAGGPI